MVLRPSFAHLPRSIAPECMLERWGGTLAFDLDAYVEWRAAEEGIELERVCARGGGRAFEPERAAANSEDSMNESLHGGSVTITARALIHGEADDSDGSAGVRAKWHAAVEKRGSGKGYFSTTRWKPKLLTVSGLGLVYFDSTEVSTENKAARIVPLGTADRAERRAPSSSNRGPAFQFALTTAAREYLFGAADEATADAAVAAINAQVSELLLHQQGAANGENAVVGEVGLANVEVD